MSNQKSFFNQTSSFFYSQQNAIYLILIVLLGTTLRLYDLGTESFWFDEIYTVHRVSQDLQTLVHQFATQGNVTRNAVYYLLAHFWVMPFEITEVSIRSLSVLFGVLSIGMMYLVGQQMFSEKVGLLSSLFMAVSEFQIQYSQEARFYSLFVLVTLVSIYCYILAVRLKQPRLWIFSALINILLFYTHTFAVFIFAVEYIHYFAYWKNNKGTLVQWGMSQVLLVLAIFTSLIPMLREGSIGGLGGGLAWITTPLLKDLLRIFYGYLFPQNYQHGWFFIGVSFAIGLAFFIIGAFLFNFRRMGGQWFAELSTWFRNTRFLPYVSSELTLVTAWLLCPVIIPFIYSNIFSPILVDRYTICAAPAFYLLIANVISRISRVVPIYISLVALMIVVIPGLQDYYASDINEQWQEAAAYVQENSQANDVIIFAPDAEGYQTKSFDWYYTGTLPSCSIGPNIEDDQAIADILSSCTVGRERFWVIMRGPSEVVNRFESFFLSPDQTAMLLMKERRLVSVSVYLFVLIK
jgi:mannosyltransferase